MEPRLLFPDLPAELRNIVYSNTICASQPATNAGLPFESKTYTFCHTKVVIRPVHYGNPNFLVLQKYRFQEASEYRTHLLAHAIQLHISVQFNGHMHIFVQEHWDQKMSVYLKNLLKKYPFLDKVADYDIQVFWAPNAFTLEKKRRNIGAIAKRMVEVLTRTMGTDLKMKKGFVKASLQIERYVALDYAREEQPLGFADFAPSDNDPIWRQLRKVQIRTRSVCAQGAHMNDKPPIFGDYDLNAHLIFEVRAECKSGGKVARREVVTDDGGKSGEIPGWLHLVILEEFVRHQAKRRQG